METLITILAVFVGGLIVLIVLLKLTAGKRRAREQEIQHIKLEQQAVLERQQAIEQAEYEKQQAIKQAEYVKQQREKRERQIIEAQERHAKAQTIRYKVPYTTIENAREILGVLSTKPMTVKEINIALGKEFSQFDVAMAIKYIERAAPIVESKNPATAYALYENVKGKVSPMSRHEF